jgi:predicted O-methyltransferase YrrM
MDQLLHDRILARTDISEHLTTLFMLVVEHGLHEVLELGTRTGESTIALLLAVKEIGGRVHSIDIDECPVAHARIDAAGLGHWWHFIRGDDMATEWIQPVDMLFVDTDHTFGHTLAELRKFEPFVSGHGVVVMHDSVHAPAVRDAAMHYFSGRTDVRIYEYINNNGLLVVCR